MIWISTEKQLLNYAACADIDHRQRMRRKQTEPQRAASNTSRRSKNSTVSVLKNVKIKKLFPQHICTSCFKKMNNAKRKVKMSTKYTDVQSVAGEVNERWTSVKRSGKTEDCDVCRQILQKGRKKKTPRGRPKVTPDDLPFNHREDDLFSSLFSMASPAGMKDTDTSGMEFLQLSQEEASPYSCPICSRVFTGKCVKTKCHPREHYFCSVCLSQVFKKYLSGEISCPVCQAEIVFQDVHATDWMFRRQLSLLKVKCVHCLQATTAGNMKHHTCMTTPTMHSTPKKDEVREVPFSAALETVSPVHPCVGDTVQSGQNSTPERQQKSPLTSGTSAAGITFVSCATSPMVPAQPTLEDTLKKSEDDPPDATEEKLYTSLTRRKLKFAAGKNVIKCKTRGQVSHQIMLKGCLGVSKLTSWCHFYYYQCD